MIRVIVICEGRTEQEFVREILAPALGSGLLLECPRLGAMRGTSRGGDVRAARVVRDVRAGLGQGAYVTTLLDYYATSGIPDAEEPRGDSPKCRVQRREAGLLRLVAEDLGPSLDVRAFRPHFVLHEFEALLFSDPVAFASGIYAGPDVAKELLAIREAAGTPEDINDSAELHPSARLGRLLGDYDKVAIAANAAVRVGLPAMRRECPHFAEWVAWLESLANAS